MADEITLHYLVPGDPAAAMTRWRSDPPRALHDFKIDDEAYDAITYVKRYYDWPAKLLFITTLGFALLFKGFLGSIWELTVRFGQEDDQRTRVTIVGNALPEVRRQLGELANRNGGPVDLAVGV